MVSAFPGSNPGASDKELVISEVVAIVLAAGQGKRMKAEQPKVLHKLKGKPLLLHVIDAVMASRVKRIIAVVGFQGERVIEALPQGIDYVWQREQSGTGHAVMQAEEALADFEGKVLVVCGDTPLIRPETFNALIAAAEEKGVGAALLTMEPKEPAGYGRIIKDKAGRFLGIVEEKDASLKERLIREVNTGTYVFDKSFLFAGLKELNNNNVQGEYYLTDALSYIVNSGFEVKTLTLKDPMEGSGVNSPEDLEKLERYSVLK